jgi:hypothetical protein
MAISGWTLTAVAGKPFAIALDNRGKCYWRGTVGPSTGAITRGSRPRLKGAYMLGHETLSVGTDGTNLNAYQGARIYISDTPTANPTVRAFGGTADPTIIHLGGVQYAVGTTVYGTSV